MTLTPTSAPYSGPWRGPSNSLGKPAYSGLAAIALKRTASRAGFMTWASFDNHYNHNLEGALKKIQKQHGLPVTGQTGPGLFNLLKKLHGKDGLPAMDHVAVLLFEQEYQRLHPPKAAEISRVRAAITDYWETCIAHAAAWHYRQYRPVNYDVSASAGGSDDCSSKATASYFQARKKTGIAVPDPNGANYGYNGYGNTVSLYLANKARRATAPYQVGDLALYGPSASRHVVCCIHPGDENEAVWGSNGSEGGPYAVRLRYRSDLFAVVRPPLLPS